MNEKLHQGVAGPKLGPKTRECYETHKGPCYCEAKVSTYIPSSGVWTAEDARKMRDRVDATVSALIAALDDACEFMPRDCVSGKCGNEDCTPHQIGRLLDSVR